MTDREKEIAIAKKLGWTARLSECKQFTDIYTPEGLRVLEDECFKDEDESWWRYTPNYLTDRNASAEIVEHFADSDKWLEFSDLVTWNWNHDNNNSDKMIRATSYVFIGLRATPRQIALSALAVWGIEEGEAK